MLAVILVSIVAGIILGAPVGVAGALVADAALSHDRRRVQSVIFASILSECLLAFLASFFAAPVRRHILIHQNVFFLISGVVIIVIGLISFWSAWRNHRGISGAELEQGSIRWLLKHTAPPVAVFFSNLLHPGNMLAFLFTVATLSTKIVAFNKYYYLFGVGIFIGSGIIFTISALFFWQIRKKADKFVHYFRYVLAGVICIVGLYLIFGKALD